MAAPAGGTSGSVLGAAEQGQPRAAPRWLCRAARPHGSRRPRPRSAAPPPLTRVAPAAPAAGRSLRRTREARFQVKEGQKQPQPLPLLWPRAAHGHVQGKRRLVSEGLSLRSAPGGEAKCRARRRLVRGQPRAISSLRPGDSHLVRFSCQPWSRVAVTKGFFRHNPAKRRQSCYVSRRQELRL